MKKSQRITPFYMYADAQPSEAIQADELSGLAVACILPYQDGVRFLNPPVKQYKEYDKWQKADRANRLQEWLLNERENGLVITGFLVSRSLEAAARYGLDLIEELPDTYVESHYGKYRLYFGEDHISFSQAVALMYYSFVLNFAVLHASQHMREGEKHMITFLDSFPGTSYGDLEPGEIPAEKSQGMKFIEFLRARSETSVGIDEENGKRRIYYKTDQLVWWKQDDDSPPTEGKKHPHFTLVDWLTASARATHFRDEFICSFPRASQGEQSADALGNLYSEFKKFRVWEIADDNTLDHIRSNAKHWSVPVEARNYILSKAAGS